MKKIDLDYFSIDTDFREQNLLVSFLLEGTPFLLDSKDFSLSLEETGVR